MQNLAHSKHYSVNMEILNISWSNAFVVFSLGTGIVFVVLILLVFLLNIFSWLFVRKKELITDIPTATGVPTETEATAIAMALHLFHQDIHNEESCIITIGNKKTLWNSKIFGLNKFPI